MPHLVDLEELALKCRNDASRGRIEEALSCYKARAYRSSIVSTWIAVVYDFVDKLRDLSVTGDTNARRRFEEFENICANHDLARSLAFERQILDMAKNEFELLSELEHDELSRLLADRHKCAHPSMHNATEPYRPTAEAARYHLRNAVELFLRHPPAQGKATLDRLISDLDRTYYPTSLEDLETHLGSGPLARPRKSLLRNFVILLLKKLLLSEAEPEQASLGETMVLQFRQERRAKRIILTLEALYGLRSAEVIEAIGEYLNRLLQTADDSKLPSALQLFSAIPESWGSVDQAGQNLTSRFVRDMPIGSLDPHLRLAWGLSFLRPPAEDRLRAFGMNDWQNLGAAPFPSEWLETALNSLESSTDFKLSNKIIRGLLIPGIEQLTIQQIERVIGAARVNRNVKNAFALKELLASAVATSTIGQNPIMEILTTNNLLDEFRDSVS